MSLRKEVLKPTIQLLAYLGTLARKCFYHSLRGNCKQTTSKGGKTSNFRPPPPPPKFEGDTEPRETEIIPGRNFSKATVQHKQNYLEFSQASPNAYQLIALCLGKKLTHTLTEAPVDNFFSIILTNFCQFQEVILSP